MTPIAHNCINIFFFATEADPFIKVGGLGDYAGSLPVALREIPHNLLKGYQLNVQLVIPFYRAIQKQKWNISYLFELSFVCNRRQRKARVYSSQMNGVTVYLIGKQRLDAKNKKIYSSDPVQNGKDYIFYSFAFLELIKHLNKPAQILHLNDWHSSFISLKLLQLRVKDHFYQKTRSVLTIHNLAYMGAGSEQALIKNNLLLRNKFDLPDWAQTQPLPLGLVAADLITTVSPEYGKEICTSEYGFGLEKMLKKKGIVGIQNGIDLNKWNPAGDPYITARFNHDSINKRMMNKQNLQKHLGLASKERIPLLAFIGRLDLQKGIDILIPALEQIFDTPWQIVILGTGDYGLEKMCLEIEKRNLKKVRAIIRFDDKLARSIYAGADILIIPSRFEPCGTTQMIAMHYGCIPVAHAVGGLINSISHGLDGFLFSDLSTRALSKAIEIAIDTYCNQPEKWIEIQKNAMRKNFSWKKSALLYAKQYIQLFEQSGI